MSDATVSASGAPSRATHDDVAHVNGVPIRLWDTSRLLAHLDEVTRSGRTTVVNHLAAHPTVLARDEPEFRHRLSRAVNVADGMGVVWACRLHDRQRIRHRVYGPTFMLRALDVGRHRGWRHAFVGGTPASLERMLEHLEQRLPGIEVVGAHAPPFRPITAEGVAEDISHLGTDEVDLLWVGLGTPKQQIWADLARARRPARAIVTVGAAFDMFAGDLRQAPQWMQRTGLEWCFRLAMEPRRLAKRYLVGNIRFVAGVAVDEIRRRRGRRGGSDG